MHTFHFDGVGGLKLVLSKVEHNPIKLLYFINKHKSRSLKCAKIGHIKNHLNLPKHKYNSNFQTFYLTVEL